MLYPPNLEEKLGFDKVRTMLEEGCESSLGKQYVQKIKFSTDVKKISKWLNQTQEFASVISSQLLFPNSNFIDISPLFGKIKVEDSFLQEEEMFEVLLSLKTMNKCLDFFSENRKEFPVLSELTEPLLFDEDLMWTLDRKFDERGLLKDNASDRLYDIRKGITAEKQRLRSVLDSIIRRTKKEGYTAEDVLPTIRNGRMVIPVFAEHKRRLKGFIHGESATGQTVYLEPTEVFEINNEVQELEYSEKREMVRILMELTGYLRPEIENFRSYMKFLGLIDFIRAKARYALQLDAIAPQTSSDKSFRWNEAKHPLLLANHKALGKKVVPLTIALSGKERILLISGPNAGGKSVCLKTVGLLQYMYQSGLLVPVKEDSVFTIFKDIFIDIGDEQSIENDLSTYSSHLMNMKHLLAQVNKKSLFLIDEFGTGTEPQYGAAIAEAILMELQRSKGMGVITTHYSNLKQYADEQQGLLNGAMKYDLKHLQPLYELEMGKPGSSFAFEIATKIGLPNPTIAEAKKKMGVEQVSFDQMLTQLQLQQQEMELAENRLVAKEKELTDLTEQYAELKNHLEQQKQKVLDGARKEAHQIVTSANRAVEQAIREIQEKKAEKQAVKAQREKLEKIKEASKTESTSHMTEPNDTIKVGDYVRLDDQETVGQVIQIKGKDATLSIGELTSFVKLNRLTKVHRKDYKEQSKGKTSRGFDFTSRQSDFSPRLDIRGMRAEEALPHLTHWVDEAILLSQKELQIVHGKGNGVLRELCRNALKDYSEVTHIRDEHADRGGAGVTLFKIG